MAEPAITLRAIHDSGAGNLIPTRVVIHATCPNVGYPKASGPGTALGTARYFQQAAAGGSAHYICGIDSEQHCVPDSIVAWHAPPNPRSIGIEINAEGGDYPLSYTRAQWLSPQVWPGVLRAAARTRELCQRFAIPMTRLSVNDLKAGKRGICGHVDVSQAFKQSTHSDPGPQFPWAEFMAAVTGGTLVIDGPPREAEIMRYVNLDNPTGNTPDRAAILTIDAVADSLVMPLNSRAWIQWAAFYPFGGEKSVARLEWMVQNFADRGPLAWDPIDLPHRGKGAIELQHACQSVEVVVRGIPAGGSVGFHLDGIGHG